jgi:hypothetical protein
VTAQEQIAKLESLLERIRRNAERPRRVAVTEAGPAAHPAPVQAAAAPAPVQAAAAPSPKRSAAPEEVSLESLGAVEAVPSAVPARERVPSADMEDLEIVEIGTDVTELVAGDDQAASSEAAETLEEPVPESAPRPAVQSVEVEIEPPIKTPPPESGRQAVTPPPAVAESRAAAQSDDFDEDDLLETDLSGGPISIATPGSPTMAQLGDTVNIEGAGAAAADLELAAPEHHREVPPSTGEAPSRRVDPLATTAPDMRTALSLAQTVPDARSPFADAVRATTEAKAEPPPPKPAAKAEEPARALSAPELVVERPISQALHPAEIIVAMPRKLPDTFLELLESSLELRA